MRSTKKNLGGGEASCAGEGDESSTVEHVAGGEAHGSPGRLADPGGV